MDTLLLGSAVSAWLAFSFTHLFIPSHLRTFVIADALTLSAPLLCLPVSCLCPSLRAQRCLCPSLVPRPAPVSCLAVLVPVHPSSLSAPEPLPFCVCPWPGRPAGRLAACPSAWLSPSRALVWACATAVACLRHSCGLPALQLAPSRSPSNAIFVPAACQRPGPCGRRSKSLVGTCRLGPGQGREAAFGTHNIYIYIYIYISLCQPVCLYLSLFLPAPVSVSFSPSLPTLRGKHRPAARA